MKELESKSKKKNNGNNDSDGGNEPQFLKGKSHRKRQQQIEEHERLQRRNAMLKSNLYDIHNDSKKYNYETYLQNLGKSKPSAKKDDVDFDF